MFINLLFAMLVSTSGSLTVFNFSNNCTITDWYIVNDDVMGGVSRAKIAVNGEGNGVFSGTVSLENNGGFASIRHRPQLEGVKKYKTVVLRVKGDGKEYQFRFRERSSDRHAYKTAFKTTGEWQTIEFPINSLYPSWRGRKLDMPNFESDVVEEITLLIANKQAESFRLEIDWIKLKP